MLNKINQCLIEALQSQTSAQSPRKPASQERTKSSIFDSIDK